MAATSRASVRSVRVSESFEFTFLQDTEQLGLKFEGRFSDLVQEYRAAIGQLESTDPLRDRAGKRAFFVAKQLAFEQAGGNGGAVVPHERVRAPRTQIVEGARDQFLPRTRLTADEHGRAGGGDRFELRHDVPERRAPSNNPFADDVLRHRIAEEHGTLRGFACPEPRSGQGRCCSIRCVRSTTFGIQLTSCKQSVKDHSLSFRCSKKSTPR